MAQEIARLGLVVDSRGVVKATKDLNRLERQGNETERSAKSLTKTTTVLNRALVGLAASFAAREVISYTEEWKSLQNQLRQVTDSTAGLNEATSDVIDIAKETRSDLGATANLYARLTRATKELTDVSKQDLLTVTRAINQSFVSSGASADEARNAIIQLSQGLAAGALRGDEFNSVAEQAPEILQAIAEYTGKTVGELREFAAEGGITSRLIVDALLDQSDAIDKRFAKSLATLSQQLDVAKTNLTAFFGQSETFTSATDNLGEAVVDLSNNLDTLATIGTQLGIVLGASLAGRAALMTKELAAAGVAALTTTGSVTGLNAAMGLTARRATAASVATKGLTVATTGLRRALSLLGGPVGILSLVAAEVYLYSQSLDDAAKSTSSLSKEELKTKVAIRDTKEQIESLRETVQAYQKNLDTLTASGASKATTTVLQSAIDKYNAEIKTLEGKLKQLVSGPTAASADSGGGGQAESYDKAKQSLDQLNASLLQQVTTFGQGETAVLKYRLQFGDLSDEIKALGEEGESYAQTLLQLSSIYEKLQKDEELRLKALEEQERKEQELLEAKRQRAIEEERLRQELADSYESVRASLLSAEEAEREYFRRRMEIIRRYGEMYPEEMAKANALSQAEQERHFEALKKIYEDELKKTMDTATDFVRRASENMQDAMAEFFFDFMQGELGDLDESFKRTIDRMVANAIAADLGNALFGSEKTGSGLIGSFLNKASGKLVDEDKFGGGFAPQASDSSWLGGLVNKAADLFSFDGGGFTGYGARAGGLDGKGGFPALLHPNETVIDHTKNNTNQNTYNITVNVPYAGGGAENNATRRTRSQMAKEIGMEVRKAIARDG